MSPSHPDDLVNAYRGGTISRRAFVRRATAAGLSAGPAALLANQVVAQGMSPVAGTSPASTASTVTGAAEPGGRSINREEYYRLIHDTFDLSEPAVTGGTVIYGAPADIDTLNPQLVTDVLTGRLTSQLFVNLVGWNPTNGFPAPGLADYWELAGDGITYTFHLNPNATWHDGEPITADDVIFSIDAALDPANLGGVASTLGQMLATFRAVDAHTVELVAPERLAVFVEYTAGLVSILPKHIWQDVPLGDWGADPGATGQDPARVVGSGPFRFVEWAQNDHVTLARNDTYWDPDAVPTIDAFIYQVIPSTSSATEALRIGEIDLAAIALHELDTLEDDPDITLAVYDTGGWTLLNMNQDPDDTELFVDVPVRQALMYALDRELIAEEIFFGYATQADGTHAPLSIAYAPDRVETIYTYDPERARRLLEEAGWVDTDGDGIREKDGVAFRFECLYADNVGSREQILTYAQQAWREVGIDMTPVQQPFQTVIEVLQSGEYEMILHGFSWGVDGSQGDLFRCDAVPPAGFNDMHYCNPRYDELDRQQVAELDVEKRIELLIEQSNIVNDEVAVGVLLFSKLVFGSRATLHNFLPNGYGEFWSIPWWWTEVQ